MTLNETIVDFEAQIRDKQDFEIVSVTVERLRLLLRHLHRLLVDEEFNALIKEAK